MVHYLLLTGAGLVAGVLSTVVGLASLVSYPALLLAGLPPVAANVTNTVALVATGIGAAAGSREELAGQGRLVARLCAVSATGGAAGAVLLLTTPARVVEIVVPVLIAGASGAGRAAAHPHRDRWARPRRQARVGRRTAVDRPAGGGPGQRRRGGQFQGAGQRDAEHRGPARRGRHVEPRVADQQDRADHLGGTVPRPAPGQRPPGGDQAHQQHHVEPDPGHVPVVRHVAGGERERQHGDPA